MEDTLEVYKRPYDEAHPLICMDESSKQQIKDTRAPIPAKPGTVARYDTEYERNGVSNVFMFFEPLQGKRVVEVTDQRTAIDWAHQIRNLVDVHYPKAKRITLVMDNLNTILAPLYIRHLSQKRREEFLKNWKYTTHPSMVVGLNMAEIELSILSRQCMDRRIPDQETLKNRNFSMARKKKCYCPPYGMAIYY